MAPIPAPGIFLISSARNKRSLRARGESGDMYHLPSGTSSDYSNWIRGADGEPEPFLAAVVRNLRAPANWHLLHLPPGHWINIPSVDAAKQAAHSAHFRLRQAAVMADARAMKVRASASCSNAVTLVQGEFSQLLASGEFLYRSVVVLINSVLPADARALVQAILHHRA